MPDALDPVTPERVAKRLGVDPDTLTDLQRERIEEAIIDARAKVVDEIGRWPVQESMTFDRLWPDPRYALSDWRAWPLDFLNDNIEITAVALGEDGYIVTALVGIDGDKEVPILRFIIADVVESIRSDPSVKVGERSVKSVSAEGQSITWADAPTAAAAAGSPPSVTWLRRYKRLVWAQQPSLPSAPWPYSPGGRY